MNAPVLIRVGQGLISCIDDGAILLHPFEEIIHDVVCTLRDLKRKGKLLRITVARSSRHEKPVHLNPAILRTRRADTSGPCKDLSGYEEGHKRSKAPARKGKPP